MKLDEITIRGFRSLAEVSWKPGDVNLLIGPNGGGKSNLLGALDMLAAAADGRLAKFVQAAGGVDALAWNGDAEKLGFLVRSFEETPDRGPVPRCLRYALEIVRLGARADYFIDREAFSITEPPGTPVEGSELFSRSGQDVTSTASEIDSDSGSITSRETALSLLGGPFSPVASIKHYREYLASWKIYRYFSTVPEASIRKASIARSETVVDESADNVTAVLHTLYTGVAEFRREVDLAMTAVFGEEFKELVFPPAADQRVQLRVRWRSLRQAQSSADLSDGTLRFLFLLAVLANPNRPPLIAIEEPDLGLHPSMLPVVAEHAAEAARHSQVFFTTHSSSFLDAFRDRTPTTTVVECRKGRTNLTVLTGDKLDYWLEQYTLGELFRSGELEAVE